MYPFNTPLYDIEGCEIIYRKAPHWGSEVIAELHENGKFKFSIRVTERYSGSPNLTHEEVVLDLETRLLKKRLEDQEFELTYNIKS